MHFNINEKVRVKLTPAGRAAHAADFAIFCADTGWKTAYEPPKEDADGWSEWQLWSLMKEFGPHITMGLEPPFETVIQIPEPAASGAMV